MEVERERERVNYDGDDDCCGRDDDDDDDKGGDVLDAAQWRCVARRTLERSALTVIGPAPPGTGDTNEATRETE